MRQPPPAWRLGLLAAALGTGLGLSAQGVINRSLLRIQPEDKKLSALRRTPIAKAVDQARRAVVHVYVEVDSGPRTFEIERPSSGVVVHPSGRVLTLLSLVAEARGARDKRIIVRFPEGEPATAPATILAIDKEKGLALLQAKLPEGKSLPVVALAQTPQLGDPVTVVSFHDGEHLVAYTGVLTSALSDTSANGKLLEAADILMTDARIQQRNHGASLVDAAGRLVGICSAEHVQKEVGELTLEQLMTPSFGYAIPMRVVSKVFAPHLPAPLQAGEPSISARAVARTASAVVAVWAGDGERPAPEPSDPLARRRRKHLGSGVIVDPFGLVLTNDHLVHGRDSIQITLLDGRSLPATVLESHQATNMALLRVTVPDGTRLPYAICGRSSDGRPGELVLAVGNPYGHAITVSAGVVSAHRAGSRLQIDPSIGNHNAGGALIDATGAVIGIVDGGRIDPLVRAFMQQGDRAKTETNLHVLPGMDAIRKIFRDAFKTHGGGNPSLTAPAEPIEEDRALRLGPLTETVERAADSLLNVYVNRTSRPQDIADNPFAPPQNATVTGESLGSGVIISASGLALSNWHVVDSATNPDGSMRADHTVQARLRDGRILDVQVLSISREDDLCLLQLVTPPGQSVRPIELGDSDALRIGETVAAIGNPHGRTNTVTAGILSAKDQEIRVRSRWAGFKHLLEPDAAINGGNSGGPLLDITGRLVAINSAGGTGHDASGYGIPVNHARHKTLSLLLSPEKLRSTYIGITTADREDGVVVFSVNPQGPAKRTGIEIGDQIRSLDGVPITWSVGFAMELLSKDGAVPIHLIVERNGKEITAEIQPWSAAVWSVRRQTGLEVRTITVQNDADLVRKAHIAIHRRFTAAPTAVPSIIPESVVQVVEVHPSLLEDGPDIRPGDLIMAVELETENAAGEAVRLERLLTPEQVRDVFNDPAYGEYGGRKFKVWIYGAAGVKVIGLIAKRLML